jgi:hypothetical protein
MGPGGQTSQEHLKLSRQLRDNATVNRLIQFGKMWRKRIASSLTEIRNGIFVLDTSSLSARQPVDGDVRLGMTHKGGSGRRKMSRVLWQPRKVARVWRGSGGGRDDVGPKINERPEYEI